MSKLMIATVALLATATVGAVGQDRSASIFPAVDWTIVRTDGGGDQVQLAMRTHSAGKSGSHSWSSGYALSDLQGLSLAQLDAPRSIPVRFALVRDAGRLDCSGTAGNRSGYGSCRFTPDADYGEWLAARGIGRPSASDSYSLTMAGVGRALPDALAAARYPRPTLNQLVAMGIHGVSPSYVQSLARLGYAPTSPDSLVTFRIHGVDADYIRAMAALGPQFRSIPADDLVAFRIHGVTPALVGAYHRLGVPQFDRRDVVAMAIHGVTPAYIESFQRLGIRALSAKKLVQMRIFGVTADDVRALQKAGVAGPIAEQLVQHRMFGHLRERRR